MAYQLPQELQTTKLSSLPDDAKALAEELIAKKFGYGEVVKKKNKYAAYYDSTPDLMYDNTLRGDIIMDRGRHFRFAIPATLLTPWGASQESVPNNTIENMAYELTDKVIENIVKFEEAQRRNFTDNEFVKSGMVEKIFLELNGYRGYCEKPNDIYNFIKDHLR